MKKILLSFLCLSILIPSFGQDIVTPTREKIMSHQVYAPGKSYDYQVIKYNEDGDTISDKMIKMEIPFSINQKENSDLIYFVWHYDYMTVQLVNHEQKEAE